MNGRIWGCGLFLAFLIPNLAQAAERIAILPPSTSQAAPTLTLNPIEYFVPVFQKDKSTRPNSWPSKLVISAGEILSINDVKSRLQGCWRTVYHCGGARVSAEFLKEKNGFQKWTTAGELETCYGPSKTYSTHLIHVRDSKGKMITDRRDQPHLDYELRASGGGYFLVQHKSADPKKFVYNPLRARFVKIQGFAGDAIESDLFEKTSESTRVPILCPDGVNKLKSLEIPLDEFKGS